MNDEPRPASLWCLGSFALAACFRLAKFVARRLAKQREDESRLTMERREIISGGPQGQGDKRPPRRAEPSPAETETRRDEAAAAAAAMEAARASNRTTGAANEQDEREAGQDKAQRRDPRAAPGTN